MFKRLEKLIGLETKREMYDSLFQCLIKSEFIPELRFIQRLAEIQPQGRNQLQNAAWGFFQEKYPFNGKCPSPLYDDVSLPLKRRYNILHRRMIEILYSDALVNNV